MMIFLEKQKILEHRSYEQPVDFFIIVIKIVGIYRQSAVTYKSSLGLEVNPISSSGGGRLRSNGNGFREDDARSAS